MSVIVSNEDGEIFLFCKGADEYVTENGVVVVFSFCVCF